MKAAAMMLIFLGGIVGGLLLAGHEPRVSNFQIAKAGAATSTGASVSGAAVAGAGGSKIVIKMKDFSFDPNNITAPAGKITLTLQNYGRYTHNLRILIPGGENLESGRIGAGFSRDFTVTLQAGTYDFDCSVSNHAKRGMTGKLVVK
jgi:plastocyanin